MSFFHFVIEYKSGAKFEYAYEVNITEEQAFEILAKIEAKLPEITFDGRRIYPKRIRIKRIYSSESRYSHDSTYIHTTNPEGYTGNFWGNEVTRSFLSSKKLQELIREIKEPQISDEINETLSRLISEDREEIWNAIIFEIVSYYGPKAVEYILTEIKNDSVTIPNEYDIYSTINSHKWNSIALTYLDYSFFKESIQIFEALIEKEPNNTATQNNFGVVLVRYEPKNTQYITKANELFQKAYESDKKRGGEEAKNLPAYKNLLNLEKGAADAHIIPMGNPSYHYILFMDIVGFSRPTWYGTIQVEKINYLTDYSRVLLTEMGLNFMEIPMLPTGDGMALFFNHLNEPIEFAIRISEHMHMYNETQESDRKLELRIGIHAGASFPVQDLHRRGNRCGPAITTARRIMDFGDSWHILCSHEYGGQLIRNFGPHYGEYHHDCGSYTAKHDESINIYNIFNKGFGNPNCPKKNDD